MNKVLGIAAIFSGLAYSIISGDNALAQEKKTYSAPSVPVASAQTQDLQIKFGKDRKYTYELSQEQYTLQRHIRRTEERLGSVWGILHIDSYRGKFELWGVLPNNILFHYLEKDSNEHELRIQGPHREPSVDIKFSYFLFTLLARVNDQSIKVRSDLGLLSERESEGRKNLIAKLLKAYSDHMDILNMPQIRQKVKEISDNIKPDIEKEMHETLDVILK